MKKFAFMGQREPRSGHEFRRPALASSSASSHSLEPKESGSVIGVRGHKTMDNAQGQRVVLQSGDMEVWEEVVVEVEPEPLPKPEVVQVQVQVKTPCQESLSSPVKVHVKTLTSLSKPESLSSPVMPVKVQVKTPCLLSKSELGDSSAEENDNDKHAKPEGDMIMDSDGIAVVATTSPPPTPRSFSPSPSPSPLSLSPNMPRRVILASEQMRQVDTATYFEDFVDCLDLMPSNYIRRFGQCMTLQSDQVHKLALLDYLEAKLNGWIEGGCLDGFVISEVVEKMTRVVADICDMNYEKEAILRDILNETTARAQQLDVDKKNLERYQGDPVVLDEASDSDVFEPVVPKRRKLVETVTKSDIPNSLGAEHLESCNLAAAKKRAQSPEIWTGETFATVAQARQALITAKAKSASSEARQRMVRKKRPKVNVKKPRIKKPGTGRPVGRPRKISLDLEPKPPQVLTTACAETQSTPSKVGSDSKPPIKRNSTSTSPIKSIKKAKTTQTGTAKKRGRKSSVELYTPGSDPTKYCICRKVSFGDMVCCDNKVCRYEWFHYSCVKLRVKPVGQWFCPLCRGERPSVIKDRLQLMAVLGVQAGTPKKIQDPVEVSVPVSACVERLNVCTQTIDDEEEGKEETLETVEEQIGATEI